MQHVASEPAPSEQIIRKVHVSKMACLSALAIFAVLMATGNLGSLFTTDLALTNKRVVGKRGLFLKSNVDVPYSEVVGVKVKRGLLGSLFNYGSLIIQAKNGRRTIFYGIAEPDDIQLQIQELSETAVLGYTLAQYTQEKF
jgi:hypothetical protein